MARGFMLTGGVFCFNVDAHVGPGCPNKQDDVQLVQYAYYCTAQLPPPAGATPADMAIFKSVVPGAPYNGGPNDPLTLAIRAHQRIRGGVQDGKVSPCNSPSGSYGDKTWLILGLCGRIRAKYPDIWPRIDRCPNCPPALASVCRNAFVE